VPARGVTDAARVQRAFGDRVRAAREAAGLSQESLAELAGLHRTYAGSVERGERNLSLINIVRIASALGTDPSDLMRGLRWPPARRGMH
jgi:transcriptional regulator with XRE-family HTH domain